MDFNRIGSKNNKESLLDLKMEKECGNRDSSLSRMVTDSIRTDYSG
jgi:hypothetical protein